MQTTRLAIVLHVMPKFPAKKNAGHLAGHLAGHAGRLAGYFGRTLERHFRLIQWPALVIVDQNKVLCM